MSRLYQIRVHKQTDSGLGFQDLSGDNKDLERLRNCLKRVEFSALSTPEHYSVELERAIRVGSKMPTVLNKLSTGDLIIHGHSIDYQCSSAKDDETTRQELQYLS